jgi:hypothetical protein
MRQLLLACSEEAKTTPPPESLVKGPSQLVHSVNLAIWTSHSSQAIEEGAFKNLRNADEKSLNSLVDVVRQNTAKKHPIPIDQLSLKFTVLGENRPLLLRKGAT